MPLFVAPLLCTTAARARHSLARAHTARPARRRPTHRTTTSYPLSRPRAVCRAPQRCRRAAIRIQRVWRRRKERRVLAVVAAAKAAAERRAAGGASQARPLPISPGSGLPVVPPDWQMAKRGGEEVYYHRTNGLRLRSLRAVHMYEAMQRTTDGSPSPHLRRARHPLASDPVQHLESRQLWPGGP
eukprot:6028423-Prymnesium_polylepis.2